MDLERLLVFLLIGLATSAVYAISATGLVVTYVTSGVFNFAHGAIGMFLAFLYWELSVNRGWPTLVALFVTLFIVAPIIGVALDVVLMRRLVGAAVAISLVVTLALLLTFQGLALAMWGMEPRALPDFFPGRSFSFAGLVITWHQTITILAAVAVALGLRTLFRRTRLGIAMRAVVDNTELCSVKGLNPNLITAVSWAMGSMLAGLAAILIAPGLNLEVNTLSLLVVSAYAAAIFGRLRSLPATFVGAVVLGVSQAMVTGYLPIENEWVARLRPALPFVLLFGALLVFRETRLTAERFRTREEPAPPKIRTGAMIAGAAVLLAIPLSGLLSDFHLLLGSRTLLFAAILLSLAVLAGSSGQISLMQMSFVGIGAVTVAKLPGGFPFTSKLVIAALVAGVCGMLIALPALRLRGIYLALLTLASAILMDEFVFGNRNILGGGVTLVVDRPSFLGFSFDGERSMFVLLVGILGVFSLVFHGVRRSSFGRMLAAVRDAPNACQALGMNVTAVKMKAFGLSALLAGVAGVFFGGLQNRVGQLDFLWFQSLVVLLVATIFGIASVSGAVIGASFVVLLPEVARDAGAGDTAALVPLTIGTLAVITARRPEGLARLIRDRLRPLWTRRPETSVAREPEPVPESREVTVADR